ncbi:uncharacterized protein CLUP02_10874 [Colletotrichum lupini]|uniref:Uncharacterized protein n=1 Tax=Colletotrichum lupini TaxID=145971 RepID=A0A9Q8SXJ0_9PEZI|nr:uncharacterized protein CLUP02_10874 [Colletotrichum lupini]UQC85377.1 hypothetical protein CLUP02_10874 [Colletotrichum lupini]
MESYLAKRTAAMTLSRRIQVQPYPPHPCTYPAFWGDSSSTPARFMPVPFHGGRLARIVPLEKRTAVAPTETRGYFVSSFTVTSTFEMATIERSTGAATTGHTSNVATRPLPLIINLDKCPSHSATEDLAFVHFQPAMPTPTPMLHYLPRFHSMLQVYRRWTRLAGYMPATCRREQPPFFAVLQTSRLYGSFLPETSFRRPYNTRIAFRIRTQFMLCFPDGSPRSLIATSLVDGQSDAADPQHSSQASLQSDSSRGKSNWGNTPEALAPNWGSTHENESECGTEGDLGSKPPSKEAERPRTTRVDQRFGSLAVRPTPALSTVCTDMLPRCCVETCLLRPLVPQHANPFKATLAAEHTTADRAAANHPQHPIDLSNIFLRNVYVDLTSSQRLPSPPVGSERTAKSTWMNKTIDRTMYAQQKPALLSRLTRDRIYCPRYLNGKSMSIGHIVAQLSSHIRKNFCRWASFLGS